MLKQLISAIKTVNLPLAVRPNPSILDKIEQRRGQRTRIADRMRKFEQIVAEIDFLYTISSEVPSALNDDQWAQLLGTVSATEREHLLRTIHYAQMVEEATTAQRQNANKKIEHLSAAVDDVAHSSTINWQLFGDEYCDQTALKERIDARFGMAMCRNFVLEPSDRMPNLVMDCRFMYAHKAAHILSAAKRVNQLHMSNWTSSAPFPINIVNFFADDTVNRTVKNQWHFLYGTPNEQIKSCHNFVPHPFAPKVTTRGVTEMCAGDAIKKDQVCYVSQRALDYLPTNLGQFRAFVLLPFDDWEQKWLLPTKAALAEQIPCYRLPLDQHICDVSRNIPCWLVANILREVYTGRMSWAMAARRWGRELTSLEYRPNSDQIDPEQLPISAELYMEKRKLRAQMLEKLEQYSHTLTAASRKQQKGEAKNGGGAAAVHVQSVPPSPKVENNGQTNQQQQLPKIGIRHAHRIGLTPALVGSVKNRKYSREERNQRRLEEAKEAK